MWGPTPGECWLGPTPFGPVVVSEVSTRGAWRVSNFFRNFGDSFLDFGVWVGVSQIRNYSAIR
jgi:hypothetical protein